MDSMSNLGYLNWGENPLDETTASRQDELYKNLLINLGVQYELAAWLNASIRYQYASNTGGFHDLESDDSYLTRDLINNFTTLENGTIHRTVPLGDYFSLFDDQSQAHQVRGQLNLDKTWGGKHQLNALAAAELRQSSVWNSTNTYFGYDPQTLSFAYVDPVNAYPTYLGYTLNVPYSASFDDERKRFVSVLANVAYSYDRRYVVSLSARKDASNLFGVKPNRRGSPFWSAGLAWNLHEEAFFNKDLVQQLKLRLTYGYSGNTNNNVPAIPVIIWQNAGSINQLPYVTSSTPPNPSLRWERVGTFNAGVDFNMLRQRLSGTVEYYQRRPTDLISSEMADPSTGFSTFSRNSASLRLSGLDISIHSIVLRTSDFQWTNDLLFSYNKSLVASYYNTNARFSTTVLTGTPVEGLDRFALLAYRFMGLDHDTGAPIGSLNGEPTMDYARLAAESTQADFVNVGPSTPPYFGSFRNTFSYRQFVLSANLIYKLGYFFRRKALSYQYLYNDNNGHADFSQRWQKPGDEAFTNVPAMYYPANYQREQFYEMSDVLVEKADHIRLQEVTLAYVFSLRPGPVKQLRVQASLQNLGIIWRANKRGLDPNLENVNAIPLPFQATFGISLTL